jgi:hypothetical protein
MARLGYACSPKDPGMVGEKDPSGQVKRAQCPRSVEGSRQQGQVRLGEFLSPPEQAHGDKQTGKKRTPEFRSAGVGCGTVAMIPRERTCTAKSAVRATCLLPRRRWLAPEPFRRGRAWRRA